jgi:hypothetical protein
MPKSRSLKAKTARVRDPKKDAIFRDLSVELCQAGYEVRREKLKRGNGWKVVSGSCRALENNLIFVDQRLTQDEQIDFLKSKMSELGLAPNVEKKVI